MDSSQPQVQRDDTVGLDIGTSAIRIAVLRGDHVDNIPLSGPSAEGERATAGTAMPATLAFSSRGRLIGANAKDMATQNPENTIYDIKRLLGRDAGDYQLSVWRQYFPFEFADLNGRTVIHHDYKDEKRATSPVEALSMLLVRAKEMAEAYLGHPIIRAVASIPVAFSSAQRNQLEDAACVAGLDIVRFVHSPTAIAVKHAFDDPKCAAAKTLLVYDMGSGYFNAGIFKVENGSVQAKGLVGADVGSGNEIDTHISDLCARRFNQEYRRDPRIDKVALHRLRLACGEAKHALSTNEDTRARVDRIVSAINLDIRLTRDYFLKKAGPTITSSLVRVEELLREVRMTKLDIDEVIITGGSMQMPGLRSLVADFFGEASKTTRIIPLDRAEVEGTAVIAAWTAWTAGTHLGLAGSRETGLYSDALARSLEVEYGLGGNRRCATVLRHTMEIPCRRSVAVSTSLPGQRSLDVALWESSGLGRTRQGNGNASGTGLDFLGEMQLRDIEYAPEGIPLLSITLEIDKKMALLVTIKNESTMRQVHGLLDGVGRLSGADMARLIARAEKYRADELPSRRPPRPRNLPALNTQRSLPITIKDILKPSPQSPRLNDIARAFGTFGNWLDTKMGELSDHHNHDSFVSPPRTSRTLPQPPRRAVSLPVEERKAVIRTNSLKLGQEQQSQSISTPQKKPTASLLPPSPLPLKVLPECPIHEEPETMSNDVSSLMRSSNTSAAISTPRSSDSGMESIFTKSEDETRQMYTDAEFDQIGTYLRNNGHKAWADVPRLYTVLRLVGELDMLDQIIGSGITDIWFPFRADSLPATMRPSVKASFLDMQGVVLSKALSFEKSSVRKHVHFAEHEPLPFQVVGTLGSGAYGEVDKVMSNLSHREYARKRFRKPRALKKEDVKTFLNELQILKRISHRHCIELVGSYSDNKYFALLIDPAAECNLSTYYDQALASQDKLSLLRGFFGCLATALAYLHEQKITHQDIKPQNILVKADRVLLTDFGFSRDWEHLSKSTTVSDTGKTWLYAAPEVARYEPRNTAADIWSLGCVFLEMATVLRRRPVRDLQRFFEERSCGARRFFNNVPNFSGWMDEVRKGTNKDTDEVEAVLEWVGGMLCEDMKDRMTAADLCGRISEADAVGAIPYCRPCCRDGADDSSVAGDDDGELWED